MLIQQIHVELEARILFKINEAELNCESAQVSSVFQFTLSPAGAVSIEETSDTGNNCYVFV